MMRGIANWRMVGLNLNGGAAMYREWMHPDNPADEMGAGRIKPGIEVEVHGVRDTQQHGSVGTTWRIRAAG